MCATGTYYKLYTHIFSHTEKHPTRLRYNDNFLRPVLARFNVSVLVLYKIVTACIFCWPFFCIFYFSPVSFAACVLCVSYPYCVVDRWENVVEAMEVAAATTLTAAAVAKATATAKAARALHRLHENRSGRHKTATRRHRPRYYYYYYYYYYAFLSSYHKSSSPSSHPPSPPIPFTANNTIGFGRRVTILQVLCVYL